MYMYNICHTNPVIKQPRRIRLGHQLASRGLSGWRRSSDLEASPQCTLEHLVHVSRIQQTLIALVFDDRHCVGALK